MLILQTRVYREGDRFFRISAFEVQKGMRRPLALAGASNGLETRLHIQQFMISMQVKECKREESKGSIGRGTGR